MKKLVIFGLCMAMLSNTACALQDIEVHSTPDTTEPAIVDTETLESSADAPASGDASEGEAKYKIGDKIKMDPTNNSMLTSGGGTMYMTITEAKAYRSFVDSGLPVENLQYDASVDYQEDRPFIFMHIIIENVDALAYMSDENGYDDYDFRIDVCPFVISKEHVIKDDLDVVYANSYVLYFSEKGAVSAHDFAYNLAPGETKEFDVGFIPIYGGLDSFQVGTDDYDPTEFYASATGFKPSDAELIDLELTDWEA